MSAASPNSRISTRASCNPTSSRMMAASGTSRPTTPITAIAYNTDNVPAEDVATLEVFRNPKYAGRISLPDNTDDVWSLALLATGVSDWTNVTEEQFQAAAAWLREVHPNVRAYWADPSELAQLMASGEVLVSWTWNDALRDAAGRGSARSASSVRPRKVPRPASAAMSTSRTGRAAKTRLYDFINAWLAQPSAKALRRVARLWSRQCGRDGRHSSRGIGRGQP